ncbi:MAG: hypothetical protein R3345_13490, partial [Fulvivirga sp.]|nr:hypothetical protein [Fulvivirga sp.]
MNNRILYFGLMIIFLISCGDQAKEDKQEALAEDALQGTWRLVKFIDHGSGDTTWSTYDDDVLYQKHITPTHFAWLKYERKDDQLSGVGGGAYTFDGETYTEDIKFFLPPGSSELGQSIPFDVSFTEDGGWYHRGYAKDMEFDAESGMMKVMDSTKIEEIWERVSAMDTTNAIMGTWKLLQYRAEKGDSLMSEYPPFVDYMKLITPSHFFWVQYNNEGDQVMGAGSGTYRYNGETYTENIEMSYPHGSG